MKASFGIYLLTVCFVTMPIWCHKGKDSRRHHVSKVRDCDDCRMYCPSKPVDECEACSKITTSFEDIMAKLDEILSKVSDSSSPVSPAPTLTNVLESSGMIVVNWTAAAVPVDRYVVSAQPPDGDAVTVTVDGDVENVTISENLVKGQTYTVSVTGMTSGASLPVGETTSITLKPASPVYIAPAGLTPSSITLYLPLPAGKYDGVVVEVFTSTDLPAISSGSTPVSEFTVTGETRLKTVTMDLNPALDPGLIQDYVLAVYTRSGSERSSPLYTNVVFTG